MKVDRTPFTTYDFIGYFIPGFMFLYLLYLTFDVDFTSILCIECKSNFPYEHLVFTFFILIFSWFVGHLLSWLSHQFFQERAKKIFDNDGNDCPQLLDLFCQGKRKIFPETKTEYQTMLKKIFDKMNIKKEMQIENKSKECWPSEARQSLFLKSMSYYMDPDKFSVIYNYLVIQGAFRAFTFSFVLHALIISIVKINTIGLEGCVDLEHYLLLEKWAKCNFWYILAFDGGTAFICWNIYLKYYRRQIEENAVFLIHKLYGVYGVSETKQANKETKTKNKKKATK